MTIKNIIFDLGGVLVEYNQKEFIRALGYTEEKVEFFYNLIYKSEWEKLDNGEYRTMHDVFAALVNKYPEYTNDLKNILDRTWLSVHGYYPDTARYLKELKNRGYSIYILSNTSHEGVNSLDAFDFMKYTDGGVYSCQEHVLKPDRRIYEILLHKYNLNASECVFIDNIEENIKVAHDIGMNGIVFKDIEDLRHELELLLK